MLSTTFKQLDGKFGLLSCSNFIFSSMGLFLSPFVGPMDSKYMLVVQIWPICSESRSNNITNSDFLPNLGFLDFLMGPCLYFKVDPKDSKYMLGDTKLVSRLGKYFQNLYGTKINLKSKGMIVCLCICFV